MKYLKITLLAIMLLAMLVSPVTWLVWAVSYGYSYVTVTFTSPVTGLVATYITDYQVDLDWSMPVDAVSVILRASDNAYPTSSIDGYEVYSGVGLNTSDTAVNFYDYLGTKYYTIWYYDIDGDLLVTSYSDEVEGEAVSDLVTQVALFNTYLSQALLQVIGFAILAFVTGIAYWHRDRWLYVLSGLAFFAYAASFTSTNIYIGLVMIAAGVYSFIKAFLDR